MAVVVHTSTGLGNVAVATRRLSRGSKVLGLFLGSGALVVLGCYYWTTIPTDPLSQVQTGVVSTTGITGEVGKTYILGGVMLTPHQPGAVFRSVPIPRYPGISIRMFTSASTKGPGGGAALYRDGLAPTRTLVPLSGQMFHAPVAPWSPSRWWFRLYLVVRVNQPGCWKVANVPVSYQVGGKQFTHTIGNWFLKTPGARCASGWNSYLLKSSPT